jgi:methylated-DNA-[protein]-cysteine S-methyltransferase
MTADDNDPILLETEKQLNEHFAGNRQSFSVILDYIGTPFQQKVWKSMLALPFGETRSYCRLAKQIGSPKAVRAVGAANGKNPISIIGPCHRVVSASGQLRGFAGGLKAKAELLNRKPDTLDDRISTPIEKSSKARNAHQAAMIERSSPDG